MIRRIEEDRILSRKLIGSRANEIENEIKEIIDISFSGGPTKADYDFFDIRGSALIYGIPGIGKTSIMNNCMRYALEEYGVDCYELVPSEIIDSLLGKASQNLLEALQEFECKERGIVVGVHSNDGVLSMDKVKEVFRRALLKRDSELISEMFVLEGE